MATTSTVVPYFLYSLGILFREGMEALLVVIALLAGIRQAGQSNRARDIYAGTLVAIAMSVALAWAVNRLIADNTSDTLEGIFQLLAAATLFYVSSWLTAKGQSDRWLSFIRGRVTDAARSDGPSLALALTAFLAVMREGAETIVFFQALLSGATEPVERRAVTLGVIAGAAALLAAFAILRRATFMLPIGKFFAATSVLLYALAVIFVGQGIASFQESGVIGATVISHVPTIPVLGIFATAQTLGAQLALLLIAAAATLTPAKGAHRPKAPACPSPEPAAHPKVPGLRA